MTMCLYCGDDRHPWWECRKRPEGWRPPKRIEGAKFVADVPEGTKLVKAGNAVIAVAPDMRPAYVTDDGLKSIEPLKGGMPGSIDRHSPGYMRDYMRKRREKLKGTK